MELKIPRSKPFTKTRWKKKDRCKRKQQGQQDQKDSSPTIEVNAAEAGKANKKKNDNWNENYLGKAARNLSQVKYYNCNKKGHYTNNCNKSLNN